MIDAYVFPPVGARSHSSTARGLDWEHDPRLHRVTRTFGRAGNANAPGSLAGTAVAPAPTPSPKNGHELIAAMDELGIERAALLADPPLPAGNAEDVHERHREVEAVRKLAPERFAGVGCIVPPELGPGSYWDVLENPRLLEAEAKEFGIRAVQIPCAPSATPPNDRWFYPLYAKCVELKLPVYIYVGMPGPLWPMYPNHPMHLDDICLAFPELVVITHHLGDPWVQMLMHLAGKFDNLYIVTSAWSPKRYPRELLEFLEGGWHGTRGADKVLFATDFPSVDLAKAVADVRNLALPDDVMERFLYRNAEQLLWGPR